MITATQWTWEYIDEYLTLPRWNALREHWKQWPPTHIAAGVFIGAGGKKPPAKLITQADIAKAMTADPRKLHWINVPSEARRG